MTDKTREDFEAWAKANHPELMMQFAHNRPSPSYFNHLLTWTAATQQSAARIDALEAEVLALRKDAAKASDLQSLIDWMVPNHDLVYHAVGATGEGFVERVRQYMAQAAIRAAIEAERGEG